VFIDEIGNFKLKLDLSLHEMIEPTVNTAVSILTECTKTLLPIPSKMRYILLSAKHYTLHVKNLARLTH
jgi:hypothetical protein